MSTCFAPGGVRPEPAMVNTGLLSEHMLRTLHAVDGTLRFDAVPGLVECARQYSGEGSGVRFKDHVQVCTRYLVSFQPPGRESVPSLTGIIGPDAHHLEQRDTAAVW